jgi:hypothetical protein
MPLHYVLFYRYGGYGLHRGIRIENPRDRIKIHVEQRIWFRYHLHERHGVFSPLLYGRCLFQQYLVNTWAMCEQNNLDWYRWNKTKLWADLYVGLQDAMLAGKTDMSIVGTRLILPATFSGSP